MIMSEETYLEMKSLVHQYETRMKNIEDLRNKKIDAVKNQNFELAADFRQKEKDLIESTDNEPYIKSVSLAVKFTYKPNYGDDRICECGHEYYRHFDTYEDMEVVGCKYCGCYGFVEEQN
jgi:hypothetical protein